jgi:hypothetical protein
LHARLIVLDDDANGLTAPSNDQVYMGSEGGKPLNMNFVQEGWKTWMIECDAAIETIDVYSKGPLQQ